MRVILIVALLIGGCADPARSGRTAVVDEKWIPFPVAEAAENESQRGHLPSAPTAENGTVGSDGRAGAGSADPSPAEPGRGSTNGGGSLSVNGGSQPDGAGVTATAAATPVPPQAPLPAMPPLPEFTGKVVAWNLFDHVAEATIETTRKPKLRAEELLETAYLHPFQAGVGNLAPLVQRVITSEFETQNFDMRDAVILPPPATLSIDVPDVSGATLSFSYCVVGKAFQGERSRALQLTVTLADEASPLRSDAINLEATPECTRWTEVTVPVPAGQGAPRRLSFQVKSTQGPSQPRQGLAVANVMLLAPGGSRAAPAVPGRSSAPNVVIFIIDAGRGDCTGPGNETFPSVTPNLDRLAAQGVGFTRAFSISNQTRPSITALLQGQHPTVGGFHARWWNFRPEVIAAYYASQPPLLPRMARQAGYLTASIGRNHFQYGTTRMGLDPGFDVVWDNRRAVEDTVNIIDRANAFVAENKDRKFLLEINISPTHQPYHPPPEYQAKVDEILASADPKKIPARTDYLGELYYADAELGRFLAALEAADIDDRTIVLVTADHGETMHGSHSCNSELFKTICHNSHGLTLYDEEIHIPLVWSIPFLEGLVPGKRGNIVSHLDVVPTLLELMGLPPQPRALGRSLIPDLLGHASQDEEIYVESRLASAVRIDGWKFILHHPKDDARTPAWLTGPENTTFELYDLKSDPFETRNLAGRDKKRMDQLRESLRRIRTELTDREKATRGFVWSPTSEPTREGTPAGEGAAGSEEPGTPTGAESEGSAEPGTPTGGESEGAGARAGGNRTAPLAPAEPSSQRSSPPPSGGSYSSHPSYSSHAPSAAPASAPAQAPTHLFLALNHDRAPRRFEGRVQVDGRLLGADSLGENRCIQAADPWGIDIDCTIDGAPAFLRLSVAQAQMPVTFDLRMDGQPLPQANLYVGRSGLALLSAPSLSDSRDWNLAYSPRPPHFLAGFDAGLFAWHDRRPGCGDASAASSGTAPEEADFEGQESINDGATRTVLKELGYWK